MLIEASDTTGSGVPIKTNRRRCNLKGIIFIFSLEAFKLHRLLN